MEELRRCILTKLNSVKIPYDAIQKKSFGYNSEGYLMGFLVEELNNILFPYGCTWETNLNIIGYDSSGNMMYYTIYTNEDGKQTFVVNLTFIIKDPENRVIFTSNSFGGCGFIGKSIGDSLKGASTDALKKCLSYSGLGGTAFRGEIDGQIRDFMFFKKNLISKIIEFISNAYNIEKDKLKEPKICSFISKSLEREYISFDEITEEDWKKMENCLEELNLEKKDTEDEKENTSGKSKTRTYKKKVDSELKENDTAS